MTVTAVKNLKQHLCEVALSDGQAIVLDKDFTPAIGENLSEDALRELKEGSDYHRAKSRALWYLDRMDYTEKALFDKLIQKGFEKKACAKLLARLCELGLVDDRRYAERMAERLLESNVSKRAALQKLLLKGVPIALAKDILQNYEVDEGNQITEIIAKKYHSRLFEENGYQRVYAALVRKGFSYSDVSAALKNYIKDYE